MPKWTLTARTHGTATCEVVADTLAEALKLGDSVGQWHRDELKPEIGETFRAVEEETDTEIEVEQDEDEEYTSDEVTCSLCTSPTEALTAHLHQGKWIGDDCCWDERLRSSE